jgi:hypothetical protein
MLTTAGGAAWLAVIVAAVVLFWSPVIGAALRRTERTGLVVLLTLLTPAGGFPWLVAWYMALTLPRRAPVGARYSPPPRLPSARCPGR